MKHILTFLLCLFVAAAAQSAPQDKAKRAQWFNNMVNSKIEYLSKQMNLEGDQKVQFEKTYRAMVNETSKIASETRRLERNVSKKDNASDLEYEKAAEAIAEFKSKEGAIELRYFNQFKTFLTKKQLFQLKIAEDRWMKELMRHRGKGRH